MESMKMVALLPNEEPDVLADNPGSCSSSGKGGAAGKKPALADKSGSLCEEELELAGVLEQVN